MSKSVVLRGFHLYYHSNRINPRLERVEETVRRARGAKKPSPFLRTPLHSDYLQRTQNEHSKRLFSALNWKAGVQKSLMCCKILTNRALIDTVRSLFTATLQVFMIL